MIAHTKSSAIRVPEFLKIFYFLVSEIEIRLKYFLEKSPKEQPMYYLSRGETTPVICF